MVEEGGWIFARKGEAYLALWSRNPYVWQDDGPDAGAEILVDGKTNVWICELGRRAEDGEFQAFRERIAAARVDTSGLGVQYESPSQGTLEYSWTDDLTRNGTPVDLRGYPRYDNPYGHAPFPGSRVRFDANGRWLDLNYETLTREASGFMNRD